MQRPATVTSDEPLRNWASCPTPWPWRATPIPSNIATPSTYGNGELSTDRANAARRLVTQHGIRRVPQVRLLNPGLAVAVLSRPNSLERINNGLIRITSKITNSLDFIAVFAYPCFVPVN